MRKEPAGGDGISRPRVADTNLRSPIAEFGTFGTSGVKGIKFFSYNETSGCFLVSAAYIGRCFDNAATVNYT